MELHAGTTNISVGILSSACGFSLEFQRRPTLQRRPRGTRLSDDKEFPNTQIRMRIYNEAYIGNQ